MGTRITRYMVLTGNICGWLKNCKKQQKFPFGNFAIYGITLTLCLMLSGAYYAADHV